MERVISASSFSALRMAANPGGLNIEIKHLFPGIAVDRAGFQFGHDQIVVAQHQQGFHQGARLLTGRH
ncbi:Uncharacterised protein [Klebsiella pneumoniae]|nr:Uncharacterised protein [Klebsiella pneumoniae]